MSECVLECSGVGAKFFLQGQLTCNVNDLKENTAQLSACCNLQGRVIFIAQVIMRNEQCFLLIIPEVMRHIVYSHLEKYAKFSKCILKHIEHSEITERQSASSHLQNILNGIPSIYPETSEKIIAQRLNLHLIPGAISFKKGCYLGQEIIARLHFKGALKHHMYLGETPATTPICIGNDILDSNLKNTGQVVDFCEIDGKKNLLFVNSKENLNPILNDIAIRVLSLPYSF